MSRRTLVAWALSLFGGAITLCWSSRPHVPDPRAGVVIPQGVFAGDVVFFHTTTWRGRLVRALQPNGDSFTHVGVVVVGGVGANDVLVAHACPVKPAMMRIDRLSDLLAQPEITSAAVYRPRVPNSETLKAAMIAKQYASRNTPFDFDFELADDRAIYCTELVWICYRGSGLKGTSPSTILFPSDLLHVDFFDLVAGVNPK